MKNFAAKMAPVSLLLLSMMFLACSRFNSLTGDFFGKEKSPGAVSASLGDVAREPSLEDLFNGNAHFQSASESEKITLNFTENVIGVWDQKLPMFANPNDGAFYAITRGALAADRFNLYLFKSLDGLTFNQVGGAIFPNHKAGWTLYDAHIAVDTSVTPYNYIMTMECAQFGVSGASLCMSQSTTPWVGSSWSNPELVIANQGLLSASTGVAMVDGHEVYVKWTMVDDRSSYPANSATGLTPEDGKESSTSWAMRTANLHSYIGPSGSVGQLLMGADQNTKCTNAWDCNNRDAQDWKRIGDHYYLIYNGGNYYRCVRPAADSASPSHWGIAIRRSDRALGPYNDSTGILIDAERSDTCGISYPVLNTIGTSTYLYYALYPAAGGNVTLRSRLVWGPQAPAQMQTMPELPLFPMQETPLNRILRTYYQVFLNRNPAPSELDVWRQDDPAVRASERALAPKFLGSAEFLNRWNALDSSSKVTTLYRGLLQREPDAAGRADFVKRIDRGAGNGEIFNAFLQSAEFGTISFSLELNRLYSEVLGRFPSASESARWDTAIRQRHADKTALARAIVESMEATLRLSTLPAESQVTILYTSLLWRLPTVAEVNAQAAALRSGIPLGNFIEAIIASPEFTLNHLDF
jgi:hypothetical protein